MDSTAAPHGDVVQRLWLQRPTHQDGQETLQGVLTEQGCSPPHAARHTPQRVRPGGEADSVWSRGTHHAGPCCLLVGSLPGRKLRPVPRATGSVWGRATLRRCRGEQDERAFGRAEPEYTGGIQPRRRVKIRPCLPSPAGQATLAVRYCALPVARSLLRLQ